MLPLHIEPHGSQEIILNNIFFKIYHYFCGGFGPLFYEKKTGECDILIKKVLSLQHQYGYICFVSLGSFGSLFL